MTTQKTYAAASISSRIQEAQAALLHSQASPTSSYEAVQRVVELLPNKRDPSECDVSSKVFPETDYIYFVDLLVKHYASDWLQQDLERKCLDRLFADTFIRGPPDLALFCLSSSLTNAEEGVKLHRLISLLESLLKENCILQIILSECTNSIKIEESRSSGDVRKEHANMSQWQSILSTISSLPDVVTSRTHARSSSDFFFPKSYIPFVCSQIIAALRLVYDLLRSERSCSVVFIAAIMGKLSSTGHGDQVWVCLLGEYETLCLKDFLWRRILQRVVHNIPDRWVEQSITPLVVRASSGAILSAFIGDLPLRNAKLRYILTQKLLLVRCFDSARVLQNVIGYLADSEALTELFLKTFEALLRAWADGSSLRHRPQEQSFYVCKAIMICLAHLKQDASLTTKVTDAVRQSMLNGLSHYLDSSDPRVRQMGCLVAEQLSGVVLSAIDKGQALNFDMAHNDLTDSLLSLLVISSDAPEQAKATEQLEEKKENFLASTTTSPDESDVRQSPGESKEALDSDDEPDELKPFPPSSTAAQTGSKKRPVYLAQCVEGLLRAHDDPELMEQCLSHAETLVRSHPQAAAEQAVEMTKVLLHLEDRFALERYALWRMRAMVALVVASPDPVCRYLAEQFYARNYNVAQRMDVLSVVAAGARELSSPSQSNTSVAHIIVDEEEEVRPAEVVAQSWRDIVQARIDKKTRRFVHGPSAPPPTPVANRFSAVAGSFFYPLLQGFGRTDLGDHLDLLGSDHLLLQRLLHTLAVVVYAAAHLPAVPAMARALLDLTWGLRWHASPGVRQGVLYAACAVVAAVPGWELVGGLQGEVGELREWLEGEVVGGDVDGECRQLGEQCLMLLRAVMQEEFGRGGGS